MAVFAEIAISLDGFAAGPNQSEENPLGEGGEALHDWAFELREWRESHGREGGETTESSAVVAESLNRTGATIMGRNMFGGGPGPWGEDPWEGWWGEEPPFGMSVFVLTHHEREPLIKGNTSFVFVTEGIESALEQARDAAGEKDVKVAGGANTIQQYLDAGLLDEIEVNIAPILLGGGERLFDNVRPDAVELAPSRVVGGSGVAHLRYRLGG